MSKITSKNLSYNTALPPFLARLQSANASGDGRHEYAIARPKKTRTADEEAEDEPLVFDEGSGESLSKKEWEERELEGKKEGDKDGEEEAPGEKKDTEKEKEKEKFVEIGGGRKRKVGKIIGGDNTDDGEESTKQVDIKKPKPKSESNSTSKGSKIPKTTDTGSGTGTATGKSTTKPTKGLKKGKKIKLSFGDDE